MGTQSDLGKWAGKHLAPLMVAKGFTASSAKTRYWKKHEGIYHFVSVHRIKQSSLVRVWVYPWAAELAGPEEGRDFPRNVTIIAGGYLNRDKIDFPGQVNWSVPTPEAAQKAFEEIALLIETVALPWLQGLRTAEDVLGVAHHSQYQALAALLRSHRGAG
jgi:hypothetical protein